jgi:hypothetical protein
VMTSSSNRGGNAQQAKAGRKFVLVLVIAVVVWSSACQKTAPNSANANSAPANTSSSSAPTPNVTNSANQPTATPVVLQTSTTTISLATPTDTYKTGYNARKNKDVATLKRVFAKDVLDFLTEMGQAEKKSLDDQLKELTEKPQADSSETRNEKIDGNRATLEYLNEKGSWTTMDFSREGNEWKIDLPKAPK